MEWAGKRIVFHTEDLPITQIWQAGSTKSYELMTLVRTLYMTAANYQCSISLKRVMVQIILSLMLFLDFRIQESEFRQLVPFANLHPTNLLLEAWEI